MSTDERPCSRHVLPHCPICFPDDRQNKSQPVQDGARSPVERRYDRELERLDRLADFYDRELCAAVEQYLARTREQVPESERGAHHGAPSSSPPREVTP